MRGSPGKTLERLVAKRVLVVEDNELNLKLFCDLLRAHGHDSLGVSDGRAALGQAEEFRPDLIITDIHLPHVSGLELIAALKGHADLAGVPRSEEHTSELQSH